MMKNTLKKLLLSDTLGMVLFCVYMVIMHLEFSVYSYNDLFAICVKFIRYAMYAVLIVRIAADYLTEKERPSLFFWGMFVLGIVITVIAKDRGLVILLLFVYGLRHISFEALAEKAYYIHLILFSCLVGGAILGIVPNWSIYNAARLRYYLGYLFATIPTTYLFVIVIMQMYVRRENVTWHELLMDVLVNLLVYSYSDSRTGMLLSMLVIALMAYFKIRKALPSHKTLSTLFRENSYVRMMLKALCWIAPLVAYTALLAVIILYSRGSPIAIRINKMLSGRIYYTANALKDYGVPLFGKKIQWFGWGGYGYTSLVDFEYNYIDISFFSLMFNKGIICLVVFMCIIALGFEEAVHNNDVVLVTAMILMLIWSMIEPNYFSLEMNVFLVYMFRAAELRMKESYK